MTYSDDLYYRSAIRWVEKGQSCVRCGKHVNGTSSFLAGVFFSQTLDFHGPQEHVPGTPVVPHVLCLECFARTTEGCVDYAETQFRIRTWLHFGILAGELDEIPASRFVRECMIEPSEN